MRKGWQTRTHTHACAHTHTYVYVEGDLSWTIYNIRLHQLIYLSTHIHIIKLCVWQTDRQTDSECVCERERERETDRQTDSECVCVRGRGRHTQRMFKWKLRGDVIDRETERVKSVVVVVVVVRFWHSKHVIYGRNVCFLNIDLCLIKHATVISKNLLETMNRFYRLPDTIRK